MTGVLVAAALFLAADAPSSGARQAVPKVRLEFDVRTTQLAEVVARAQARLDAFGATEARATQDGSRLVVELPASLASKEGEIQALLTRPHVLAFTIVENGGGLMIDLFGRSEDDPRSHELGIFREIGSWQRADATHAIESDPFLEGQREALERYLAGLQAPYRPDADHDFSLSPVPDRPKLWRTEYVDLRTRIRISRALEATVAPSDPRGGGAIELALRLLPADGERLRSLTRGHLGKKMVITIDGEVLSTPVIEGAIGDRGRMIMSDEPQARRLAAALLGGPLMADISAHSPPPADPVVGLGNLNVIGKGAPSIHCEPMPETPSLALSFWRPRLWPATEEVCGALRSLRREIEACHLAALRGHPPPPNKVTVSLVFGGAGRVEHAEVYERTATHERSRLASCLMRSARKLNFGRPKAIFPELKINFDFAE